MAKIKDIRSRTKRTNGTRKITAIKYIARHHSATASGNFDSFWRTWNGVKGWGTGGYHEIILRDGTIELCYDPTEITNGVANHNSYTYHICVVGNGSFTAEQERVFDERAKYWMTRLNLPASAVLGHREFKGANTSCPGINMDVVRARLSGGVSHVSKPKPSSWYVMSGSRGDRVTQLQRDLTALGYPLTADGIFGKATEAAVRAFQKSHKLAVDGVYGKDSQAAMRKALDAKKKPKPKPSAKPKPKKTIYRVIIDGKQVGAYSEDGNAVREARKAIEKGAKNIRIEKV